MFTLINGWWVFDAGNDGQRFRGLAAAWHPWTLARIKVNLKNRKKLSKGWSGELDVQCLQIPQHAFIAGISYFLLHFWSLRIMSIFPRHQFVVETMLPPPCFPISALQYCQPFLAVSSSCCKPSHCPKLADIWQKLSFLSYIHRNSMSLIFDVTIEVSTSSETQAVGNENDPHRCKN